MQYELLAELFNEKAEGAAAAGGAGGKSNPPRGGVVRPGKEQPAKATQASKQHRKTVGSQVSNTYRCLKSLPFCFLF